MSLIEKYSDPARTAIHERRELICPASEIHDLCAEISQSTIVRHGEWRMIRMGEYSNQGKTVSVLIERIRVEDPSKEQK